MVRWDRKINDAQMAAARDEIAEFLRRRGAKGATLHEIAAAMGCGYGKMHRVMKEMRFACEKSRVPWRWFVDEGAKSTAGARRALQGPPRRPMG